MKRNADITNKATTNQQKSADQLLLQPIARIRTEFPTKFGIPRQSSLAETRAEIIFEPAYAVPEAVRDLETYTHLWLLWGFSANRKGEWHPTVRPPRLGGNTRVGVFATRSPFRPNPIGLSSVRLEGVEIRSGVGPVITVIGADLMDGTPIYDIKPYLPYVDSHPEAIGGFSDAHKDDKLEVSCPEELLRLLPSDKQQILKEILAGDPRPAYQNDADRVYGMPFAGFDIHFRVTDKILTVIEITPLE